MTSIEIPAEACTLSVNVAQLGDAETGEGGVEKRRFSGVANSGDIMQHWYHGQLAVDLKTLKVGRQDLPVLRDHWSSEIVGMTTKVTVDQKKGISVEGVMLGATEAGREAIALLSAGYPMQMSVYVPPKKVTRLRDGETAKVNGRTMNGPGAIYEGSHLREVTMTALGVDEATSAAALSQRGRAITVQLGDEETQPMGEIKNAAALKQEHGAVYDETFQLGHADGVTAERERIAAIQKCSKGVAPEVVQKAITDGASLSEAQATFLAYLQANPPQAETPAPETAAAASEPKGDDDAKAARLAAVREGTPEPSGVDEVTTFSEGKDGDAAAKLAAITDPEEKLRAMFNEHGDTEEGMTAAQLQDEFGDVEIYLAYKRHPLSERQKARAEARRNR